MTDGEHLHDIVGRLGQLEGTIRTFMDQWRGQDQSATAGRRVMYERLELLSGQVNRVATDVQNMQQDIAEMRMDVDEKVMPTVETIRIERERRAGAKTVWVLVWGGVVALGSAMVWAMNNLWAHLRS